ncbi:DUF6173 family protein [Chthonobacter albigriseus]|uniref:DUF6173 family protein n=1 Tax=Chthonobacter albigriseus TaxID=1683161 RepID=UPI0015EF97FE|nr:DUF6173 family protein [Chthonobacter albigriseus]
MRDFGLPLIPQIGLPEIDPMDLNIYHSAYTALLERMAEFETTLDATREVGVRLVGTPAEPPFHVDRVKFLDGGLIVFIGTSTEESAPVELIQHISQVSIVLKALPKIHDEPKRIGFTVLKEQP